MLHSIGSHHEFTIGEPGQDAVTGTTTGPPDQPSACVAVDLPAGVAPAGPATGVTGMTSCRLNCCASSISCCCATLAASWSICSSTSTGGRFVKLLSPSCRTPRGSTATSTGGRLLQLLGPSCRMPCGATATSTAGRFAQLLAPSCLIADGRNAGPAPPGWTVVAPAVVDPPGDVMTEADLVLLPAGAAAALALGKPDRSSGRPVIAAVPGAALGLVRVPLDPSLR